MRRSLMSYRFTSCSNAAASPFLQAWTRTISSYAASAAGRNVELKATLAVAITTSSFVGKAVLFRPPSAPNRLTLAALPLLCCCGCALAKLLAHFVDLERWLTRGVLGLLAPQFDPLSRFQRLVLPVGEAVGLVVFLIDKLVSTISHAALQLAPIVKFPVEQAGTGGCASYDSADYCSF